jgi:cytidyltransferase-like protein
MAGGTFNMIHPGHIYFLKRAKSLGDYLIIVLASDENVLKSKGVLLGPAKERKLLLESIGLVDQVIIGREEGFFKLVESENPDIIALGYDQESDRKWLVDNIRKFHVKPAIVTIEKFGNYSTRMMMEKYKGSIREKGNSDHTGLRV